MVHDSLLEKVAGIRNERSCVPIVRVGPAIGIRAGDRRNRRKTSVAFRSVKVLRLLRSIRQQSWDKDTHVLLRAARSRNNRMLDNRMKAIKNKFVVVGIQPNVFATINDVFGQKSGTLIFAD